MKFKAVVSLQLQRVSYYQLQRLLLANPMCCRLLSCEDTTTCASVQEAVCDKRTVCHLIPTANSCGGVQ